MRQWTRKKTMWDRYKRTTFLFSNKNVVIGRGNPHHLDAHPVGRLRVGAAWRDAHLLLPWWMTIELAS
jgi:hypothetical protein